MLIPLTRARAIPCDEPHYNSSFNRPTMDTHNMQYVIEAKLFLLCRSDNTERSTHITFDCQHFVQYGILVACLQHTRRMFFCK